MHIFLHICRLVLAAYNFTISTVFYIESYVFYTKSYNHFRTIVLNSLTPITYKNKITNVVGTQGSIQFICQPIVLHSNILNLAKSPIGIGTVRLAPILLFSISETFCFLGLLLACHSRKSSWISLCSTSLTNIHSHCTHWPLPPGLTQKPTVLFLSGPSQSAPWCKQVELAPGSSQTTQNLLISQSCQNVPTNKINCKIHFLMEIIFQKHFIFYRYMDTPSKVAHTKYAVAETCISGVKLITVIHVLKLFVYNHC